MNRSATDTLWPLYLGLTLMIVLGPIRLLAADEEKKPADEAADPEKAKPVFTVPDGTPEELFVFINTVKSTPPQEQTEAAAIAHLRLQVQAVMNACEKIMAAKPDEATELRVIAERFSGQEILAQVDDSEIPALEALTKKYESDERPAVQQIVGTLKLKRQAGELFRLSDAKQDKLISDVLALIETFGLDQQSFNLANNLCKALERSTRPQLGAKLYEGLAKELKKLDRPELNSEAERMLAVARRLKLPGKFMEVQGTTTDGEEFDWKSYRGKVVLVDFWASWCGPCRREIPNVKAQVERYGDKGFAVVGINLDDSVADCLRVVEEEGLPWVNLMSDKESERGWNNPMAVQYGISGIPTAILVDKEGKVVSMTARGPELQRLLKELLGEPAPAPAPPAPAPPAPAPADESE